MSMRPSIHQQERWRKEDEAREALRDAPRRARYRAETAGAVVTFNVRALSGRPPVFFPTIAAALATHRPFLHVACPACGQVGSVDLREVDRHPEATIATLIPALSCRGCRRHAPLAVIRGLRKFPVSALPAWRRQARG